jgi:hypothetical protein
MQPRTQLKCVQGGLLLPLTAARRAEYRTVTKVTMKGAVKWRRGSVGMHKALPSLLNRIIVITVSVCSVGFQLPKSLYLPTT